MATKTPTSKTSAADYKLGVGDVLQINVLDSPTYSVQRIRVDSSGKIRLPVVGSLTVTGKTISQITKQITASLGKELVRPDVTVTLVEARPVPIRRVFVSGAVQKPGTYDIAPGWRISEVIVSAGGLTTRPELVAGSLSRGKSPATPLDLTSILRDSSTKANLPVQNGDTLRISETTFPIRIAGQVKLPGSYDVPIGSNFGDAMALAGGLAPRAAGRKITVTHVDGTVVPIDFNPNGDATAMATVSSLKLQTGDLILVPESSDRVALLGAVAKPGYYDIEAGTPLRVSQALVLAGGVTPRAALTRANIVRSDGTSQSLDLFGLLARGDQTRNLAIQPGDIITVPEGVGVSVYGAVKSPGTFPIEEGRAPVLSEVLTLAGGLINPPEDVSIRVTRRLGATGATTETAATAGTPTEVLTSSAFGNAASRDVLSTRIYDGDAIMVEALKTQFISVQGEVKNPGSIEVKENTSVVEAINKAGGPTDLALLTQVLVRHKDQTQTQLDLRAALIEGAPEPPLKLQFGDYIVVPENKRRIYVMEAVNKPGFVPVPEKELLTVGDALTKAGGPKDRAKLWQVAIFRQTPAGVPQNTVLNLRDGKTAISSLNTPLQSGDILYVPQGSQGSGFFQKLGSSFGLLRIFQLF